MGFCIRIVSIICLILTTSHAWTVGIGAYGAGGVSSSRWNANSKEASRTSDYFYGGGLIIDSAVARDVLLNYRFKGGYEKYLFQGFGSVSTGRPISRVNTSHTFGFGIVRKEKVRFWIGPQLGLGYIWGERKFTDYTIFVNSSFTGPLYQYVPYRSGVSYKFVSMNLGLELGLNINIGNYVTLFIDCGFGYGVNISTNLRTDIEGNTAAAYKTLIGNGIGIHGSMGIMIRINDVYKPIEDKKKEIIANNK
ncbi:MAG: hypothetical protein JW807_13500 [Spirochaetes bacterium]|nr:hypothetical protein [Spirochaetota bacterium]